jgi:uncharacterized membrane protein
MVATKERLDELTVSELESHDGVAVTPQDGSLGDRWTRARRPLGERLLEPIPGRWAAIGAVAWVVLLEVVRAVQPPAADPDAVDPWFVTALGTVFLVAMLSAFAGFGLRRRWGLAASLFASGLLLVSTVMCPVSGHHAGVGAWWVVQLGCALALVTTSALGLRRG